MEPSNGRKTGMPLIMIKQQLKNLQSMTVEELSVFIPFMVKCSVEREKVELINNVPIWWNSPIKYEVPFQKPANYTDKSFKTLLASLVTKCYKYHNAEYLIRFCSDYADFPHELKREFNDDATTSLYDSSLNHLLTFNNECLLYDIKKDFPPSPRRRLRPFEPVCIHLCDNCDAHFTSIAAKDGHERVCFGMPAPNQDSDLQSAPSDLLGYLKIGKPINCHSPKKLPQSSLLMFGMKLEFSSLLGGKIMESQVSKKDLISNPVKSVRLYDKLCSSSPKITRHHPFRRLIKLSPLLKPGHAHIYSFNRTQRREKFLHLLTGLNPKSRALLFKCDRRQCYVKLSRCKEPSPVSSREASPESFVEPSLLSPSESSELSPTGPSLLSSVWESLISSLEPPVIYLTESSPLPSLEPSPLPYIEAPLPRSRYIRPVVVDLRYSDEE